MTAKPNVRSLIDATVTHWGGFEPTTVRRGYLYRRAASAPLVEFVHFDNSTKPVGGLSVHVCSTIHGEWSNELGGTAARCVAQLSYLKLGPSPTADLWYQHGDDGESIEVALDRISDDFRQFGDPWFSRNAEQTQPGHLLHEGLEWIQSQREELSRLNWRDVESELKSVNYTVRRIRNPHFVALKQHLQSAFDRVESTKEERQSVSKLALEMLKFGMGPES